jgi:hypothetical protein
MAFEPSAPSATNTFVPTMNAEGTAGLVVNFSRNPKSFGLPNWASYTPVAKEHGLYLRMNIDQCARVLDSKGNNNIWARGADAPELTWNLEGFQWQSFFTQRYLYGYQLPREAEQQADFSVVSQQNAVEAQRAMTQRTVIAITAALTTSEYDANHVTTATLWSATAPSGGGYINAGTATNPVYKAMLETMFRRIHLDSRGTVSHADVVVVLNPQQAAILGQSQEIHAYLKESPYAKPQLEGDNFNRKMWGIPEYLYGFKHVIEDCVTNPNAKGASTQAGEYAWPWDKIGMFARPGGLVAPEGSMSFSTVHIFLKEDMAVETFDDPINRRTTSRFCDDFGVKVVAPVSGCIATAVLASEPATFGDMPGGNQPQGGFGGGGVITGDVAEMERRINQLSEQFKELRADKQRAESEAAELRRQLGEQSPESQAIQAERSRRHK